MVHAVQAIPDPILLTIKKKGDEKFRHPDLVAQQIQHFNIDCCVPPGKSNGVLVAKDSLPFLETAINNLNQTIHQIPKIADTSMEIIVL